MIFHKHRIIFTGIAKNASTSIYLALRNKTDDSHNHAPYARDYDQNDKELMESYTALAVSRNPYDRFISACNQIIRDRALESLDYNQIIEEEIRGLEYVNDVFIPQHESITYSKKILADYILRFEYLKEDWEKFAIEHNKTAQFKLKTTLPYENYAISRDSWQDGMDTLTLENQKYITEYYHKDFVLFGYDKLNFEKEN